MVSASRFILFRPPHCGERVPAASSSGMSTCWSTVLGLHRLVAWAALAHGGQIPCALLHPDSTLLSANMVNSTLSSRAAVYVELKFASVCAHVSEQQGGSLVVSAPVSQQWEKSM